MFVSQRYVNRLDAWLNDVDESGLSLFSRLARSIRRDYDAARAVLTTFRSTSRGLSTEHICGYSTFGLFPNAPLTFVLL